MERNRQAVHIFEKGTVPRVYTELKARDNHKIDKNLNRHFIKENTQMTNKHEKTVTKTMPIKTTTN